MKKIRILFFIALLGHFGTAQKINAQVTVNARQTGKTQLSIFKTLQRSVEDFLNKTRWSDRRLPKNHRINCSFFITVHSYSNNEFKASLQIQSSRPVFESAMTTPIFNFQDKDFNFSYTEHEPLDFNPNSFESNLVSGLGFYVYVVLGLDADTFAPNGGDDYFAKADQVAGTAQRSGRSGWSASSGQNSRYQLNRQLRSSTFSDYHQALYLYHRKGLDVMHEDLAEGKENIAEAIRLLEKVNSSRANTLLVRSFFDAKAREVASIFTGGPAIDGMDEIVADLNDLAPSYSGQWNQIQIN